MDFAAIEADVVAATQATFENVRLTDGINVFGAIMDRNAEFVGEYGMTGERRTRITVLTEYAANFTNGMTLALDPASYTTDAILAAERASWLLDRLDADDGVAASWWVK